jgi:hypothetical protein
MTLLAAAILVELFTSQGCSSCPPADRVLAQLDAQPVAGIEFIVLSEHVDYWNRLGWTDPYSSGALTARQQRYGQRFSLDGVYTPQAVVQGQAQMVGSDGRKLVAAAQAAAKRPQVGLRVVEFERGNGRVRGRVVVESGEVPKGAHLVVALASDPPATVVARGENAGRTLPHVAVVRQLVDLGGKDRFDLPDGPEWTRLVVFLQAAQQGEVLGVVRWPLGK